MLFFICWFGLVVLWRYEPFYGLVVEDTPPLVAATAWARSWRTAADCPPSGTAARYS